MVPALRRRSDWLAWGSVIATLALFIAGNAFRGATPTRLIPPRDLLVVDGWWIRLSTLYALAFAVVGALIVARRPGNRVGWVACAIGLLTVLYQFGLGYVAFGTYVNRSLPAVDFVRWLEVWLWVLPVVLMLFFLPLLFPDGKPISPRWWLLAPLVLVGFGLGLFGIHVGQVLGVIGVLLATVSLFIRYRRAGPDQRRLLPDRGIGGQPPRAAAQRPGRRRGRGCHHRPGLSTRPPAAPASGQPPRVREARDAI